MAMIEIITKEIEDTIAVRMSGQLKSSDYDVVVPLLENKLRTCGKVNLSCELDEMESITPGALWKNAKFDTRHFCDIDKVVMVGDKNWLDWMSRLTRPFTSARVKYFDNSERDEAMEWVIINKEQMAEVEV